MSFNLFHIKVGKELRNRFIVDSVVLFLAALMLFGYTYKMHVRQEQEKARTIGEGIISSIMLELRRCHDTTQLMNDLYKAIGKDFLGKFEEISAELLKDNLAIGSMYWAPEGIIRYAYPEKVDEATSNFEMLKDSIQGPKAQLAIDCRKSTIAGPHDLIEGGRGFIIRNPNFDEEGNFEAFSIMVIDCEEFRHQVLSNLEEEECQYRFAVWKDEDKTAVLLDDRYILESDGPIENPRIKLSFNAPNDHWYLTLEPKEGWTPLFSMLPSFLNILLFYIIMMIVILILMYNRQMTQDKIMAEREAKRLNEVETLNAELQKQHEEIKEARRIAEAANQAKTSFLFNMSHDIRTPMNAIIGFRNLLEKHQDEPEKRTDYLKKIEDSSSVLMNIINNVLEMARIEKGTVEIEESVWSVEQFYDTLYSVFYDLMKQKGITFTSTIKVENHYIYCDPTKLREVFLNIISNAYKYTNTGGEVHLQLEEIPSSQDGFTTFRTTISDTGIGMSEEFLPHLFEEFSRENSTTETKIEGTGLGMPIVKRLVSLMGGTIEVQSRKGVGSTFVVTLNHRIAQHDNLTVQANATTKVVLPQGKRILLAEDNDLNAEIAMEILGEAGFTVERAEDGQRAVDMMKTAPAGHYDVILMDIQMPHMNGYEATRLIRSFDDQQKAQIPIIAMTANAFEEDKREALHAGMNDHLAKPINVNALMKALANYLTN